MSEASDEQWLLAWFGDAYFTTAPALNARVCSPFRIDFGVNSNRTQTGVTSEEEAVNEREIGRAGILEADSMTAGPTGRHSIATPVRAWIRSLARLISPKVRHNAMIDGIAWHSVPALRA